MPWGREQPEGIAGAEERPARVSTGASPACWRPRGPARRPRRPQTWTRTTTRCFSRGVSRERALCRAGSGLIHRTLRLGAASGRYSPNLHSIAGRRQIPFAIPAWFSPGVRLEYGRKGVGNSSMSLVPWRSGCGCGSGDVPRILRCGIHSCEGRRPGAKPRAPVFLREV